MEIKKVLQNGSIFEPAVLSLSNEVLLAKFKNAIKLQASVALALGYPTRVSAPHTLLNGFKNLVAVSAVSGFEFKQAKAMLEAAKNAPAATAAPVATKAAAKVEAVKEEAPKEEEADVDMGGLFGDDY